MDRTMNKWLLSLLLLVISCSHAPKAPNGPAVLSTPSAQELTMVKDAIKQLLNISSLTLGDDAFIDNSWLIFDHQQRKSPQGKLILGNDASKPEKVQLVIENNQCLIVHPASGKSVVLADIQCNPL